ncbi:MAG TPA: NAD(P)/FAD-dependent oxidoreductase [Chthonomonadaceae bacterium]|nr:NAD(P)/FAD-dependent oxidoreductase [Chthonomonadaceae bacterium]
MYDAIVIGAGHNGLIAACYLARAGRRVLVLERREIVGGACVTEEVWPGYRVSTAAYLCSLLRPEIVRDLELARYGFEVYRRETAGFAPFPDGRSLFLFPDADRTRAALESFCADTPSDIDAFFRFESDIEKAAEAVEGWLLREPPEAGELLDSFRSRGIANLYPPFIEGSVRDLLDARFQSESLKAVLATDGLIGTYGGPSTPGTAYVLLHHYLGTVLGARGAWGYVRGGMGRITQALAEALQAHGGEIRVNATVARILPAPGKVRGVLLESGEEIEAPIVLSNADPYRTFAQMAGGLVPEGAAEPGWNALVTRGGASAKINLAVSDLPQFSCLPERSRGGEPGPEHLGTIHFCPDLAYLERAWEEAARGVPSTEPMIEMYLQTATDRSLTPPGRHILSLFVQYFPYNLAPGLDLDTERERFADRVIGIVSRYAPNVPDTILHRQILTPRDLEARFGLTGGHIFHGDLLPPHLWDARPASGFSRYRTPLPGLYLCGSGAHPGGCVFGAPGYNAAHTVLSDT